MVWILLAAAAAILIWTQRRALKPYLPSGRTATIGGLIMLALLSARSGRITVAVGLGLFALGLMAFWRLDQQKQPRSEPRPRPAGGPMSVEEAYAVLELSPGAGPEEIKQAHRRLMKEAHPDAGGSNHRAARLNEAKGLLLGRG